MKISNTIICFLFAISSFSQEEVGNTKNGLKIEPKKCPFESMNTKTA